jgi:hypothetical protein
MMQSNGLAQTPRKMALDSENSAGGHPNLSFRILKPVEFMTQYKLMP